MFHNRSVPRSKSLSYFVSITEKFLSDLGSSVRFAKAISVGATSAREEQRNDFPVRIVCKLLISYCRGHSDMNFYPAWGCLLEIQGRWSTSREARCRLRLFIKGGRSSRYERLLAWKGHFPQKSHIICGSFAVFMLKDDICIDLLERNAPAASSFLGTIL